MRSAAEKTCGDNVDTSFVVGGKTTKPGTFPSAALLGRMGRVRERDSWTGQYKVVDKLRFFCGGTLINRSVGHSL